MSKNTYQVYVIQAYDGKMPTGDLLDVIWFELIDTSVDGAMKRAKKLIAKTSEDKKFIRLARIIEKHEE